MFVCIWWLGSISGESGVPLHCHYTQVIWSKGALYSHDEWRAITLTFYKNITFERSKLAVRVRERERERERVKERTRTHTDGRLLYCPFFNHVVSLYSKSDVFSSSTGGSLPSSTGGRLPPSPSTCQPLFSLNLFFLTDCRLTVLSMVSVRI